ncbi:hypothetical protein [Mycolicibacterium litorale]|uniref:hypothetical protein n=1 Tax=Mycolicibacterium litorale TaxID=758802 RepID=UPI001629F2DD|nr:hypothetical protein [Mycolicibacterium litorale]
MTNDPQPRDEPGQLSGDDVDDLVDDRTPPSDGRALSANVKEPGPGVSGHRTDA